MANFAIGFGRRERRPTPHTEYTRLRLRLVRPILRDLATRTGHLLRKQVGSRCIRTDPWYNVEVESDTLTVSQQLCQSPPYHRQGIHHLLQLHVVGGAPLRVASSPALLRAHGAAGKAVLQQRPVRNPARAAATPPCCNPCNDRPGQRLPADGRGLPWSSLTARPHAHGAQGAPMRRSSGGTLNRPGAVLHRTLPGPDATSLLLLLPPSPPRSRRLRPARYRRPAMMRQPRRLGKNPRHQYQQRRGGRSR